MDLPRWSVFVETSVYNLITILLNREDERRATELHCGDRLSY
jgi:hypothetical protein